MTCINLEERFGSRYRVAREEPAKPTDSDPWTMILECRWGHIFPFGGARLAASTNDRRHVAQKLLALQDCQVVQDGDDGVTVVFDESVFSQVAKLLKPRRRKSLSQEHKSAFVSAGMAALKKGQNAKTQSSSGTHRRAPAGQRGPSVQQRRLAF